MNKKLVWTGGVVAVFVIAIIGYFGMESSQRSKLTETLTPHIKNASLRVNNEFDEDLSTDSKMTFKELFERVDASISEIDKRIIEVQTLASEKNKTITEPSVEYLRACQTYLRAIQGKYRKILAVSNAVEWAKRALEDARTSTSYGSSYAFERYRKANNEITEKQVELESARKDLAASNLKLQLATSKVASIYAPDALIKIEKFKSISEQHKVAKGS